MNLSSTGEDMRNKPRLIVIGNKIIDKDISNKVESFDFIVRFNRMSNWGMTGTRTDLLLVDPHKNFFKLLEKPYDKYLGAKQLLVNTNFTNAKTIAKMLSMGLFSIEQLSKSKKLHVQNYEKSLPESDNGKIKLTNFYLMVKWVIEKYSKDYEIWVTGADIGGREKFLATEQGYEGHRLAASVEEIELAKMLDSGEFKFLKC